MNSTECTTLKRTFRTFAEEYIPNVEIILFDDKDENGKHFEEGLKLDGYTKTEGSRIWINVKPHAQPKTCVVWSGLVYAGRDKLRYKIVNYGSKKKIRYKRDEQYFHVLLHEIGHHLVKKREPIKEFEHAASELEKEFPGDTERQILQTERYYSPYLKRSKVRRHPHESLWAARKRARAERIGMILDFRSWLSGSSPGRHKAVVEWSIDEFKRRRKDIQKLIETPGFPTCQFL